MKQVLIIGSRNSGPKNDPVEFHRSLVEGGANSTLIYWEDLELSIMTGDVSVSAQGHDAFDPKPDIVICLGWYKNGRDRIYRDVAFAVSQVLTQRGIEFWNSEMGQQRSTSKLSCMVQLALNDIPVVPTRFSLTKQPVFDGATLPFVAKAPAASRGKSNHLIETESDMQRLLADDNRYLVQPFMPNDHDLRVICVGGEPKLVLERRRSSDSSSHMNNTSQGGSATWLNMEDINPELLTISSKICKIMGRELAGIDFIPDASATVGYSCLEVNAIPQLTSGHDTELKLQALVRAITES